ncbi:MAG TPA: SdpA family antimicrobial peptide system protein [Saprospiraceae bacterium]|nr:SdpA family antimicrobial peptide system protein [Saprospiraceae bacterium]HMP22592.1 SdpA family antimicrobial peptide system protein [Saprospiraceae bacterium]
MKYTLLFITLAITGLSIAMIILFSISSFNPVRAKKDFNRQVYTFMPQGWAFFTRNPREAQVQLYQQDDKGDWRKVQHFHAHYSNAFGLSRRTTTLITELQYFKTNDLQDEDFINCESNYQRGIVGCVPDSTIVLQNKFDKPILCGEYILTFQEPVPWAWSRSMHKISMPSKVIRLNIQCP